MTTHVGSGTSQTPLTATATSLAVAMPVGTLPGHTVFVDLTIVSPSTSDQPATGPSGWTKIGSTFDSGSTSSCVSSWYRRIQAGDPNSFTWTWPAGQNAAAVATAYSGVDSTDPAPESVFLAKDATGNTARATGALTTAGARWLHAVFADRSGSTYTGLADTQRGAVTLTSSASIVTEDTNGDVAAGTYTKTATASGNTSIATTGLYAIKAGSNTPPTASAGPDRAVAPGTAVSITGTDSDSDGTIATRAWTKLSGPSLTLSGASTATVSFTPTTAGRYVLQYAVTDDAGATTTSVMNLVVTADSARPDLEISNAGGWTNVGGAATAIAALADEDDATYIETPDNPAGAIYEYRIAGLNAGSPTIKYRLSASAASPARSLLTELRMGATVIASWTDTPTTTPTDVVKTLTSGQLAAVTGRTDLRLRHTAS